MPNWVRKLVGPAVSSPRMLTRTDFRFGTVVLRPQVRVTDNNIFDAVVKRVCKRCNETWMEEPKEVVKPLILGEPMVLSPSAQKRLACWAVKTAHTGELTDLTTAVVSTAHHHWLYEKREPPPETGVWIASNATNSWRLRLRHESARLVLTKDLGVRHAPSHYVQATVIGLDKLLIVTLSTDASHTPRLLNVPLQKFRQVWPVSAASVDVPFAEPITNEDTAGLDEFFFAWTNTIARPHGPADPDHPG